MSGGEGPANHPEMVRSQLEKRTSHRFTGSVRRTEVLVWLKEKEVYTYGISNQDWSGQTLLHIMNLSTP